MPLSVRRHEDVSDTPVPELGSDRVLHVGLRDRNHLSSDVEFAQKCSEFRRSLARRFAQVLLRSEEHGSYRTRAFFGNHFPSERAACQIDRRDHEQRQSGHAGRRSRSFRRFVPSRSATKPDADHKAGHHRHECRERGPAVPENPGYRRCDSHPDRQKEELKCVLFATKGAHAELPPMPSSAF